MKLKFMSINNSKSHGINLIGRKLFGGVYVDFLQTGES